eukprot:365830-Chlamydomonas_euryale.AAC.3
MGAATARTGCTNKIWAGAWGCSGREVSAFQAGKGIREEARRLTGGRSGYPYRLSSGSDASVPKKYRVAVRPPRAMNLNPAGRLVRMCMGTPTEGTKNTQRTGQMSICRQAGTHRDAAMRSEPGRYGGEEGLAVGTPKKAAQGRVGLTQWRQGRGTGAGYTTSKEEGWAGTGRGCHRPANAT